MSRFAALSILASLLPMKALAVDTIPLNEVLADANSIAAVQPGFIIVATSDGGYLCNVNIDETYFRQIGNGVEPFKQIAPIAICVTAMNVTNVGVN